MLEQSVAMEGNVSVSVDNRVMVVPVGKEVERKSYYSKGGYSCSFRVPKMNGKGEMENVTIYFEPVGDKKVRDPNDPNTVHWFGQYHTSDPIEQAVLDHKVAQGNGVGLVMHQKTFQRYLLELDLMFDSKRAAKVAEENNSLLAQVQKLEAEKKELEGKLAGRQGSQKQ